MTCGPVNAAVNILLFDQSDRLDDRRISITGRRLEHIQRNLDIGAGPQLRAGEINGRMGEAIVEDINSSAATLLINLSDDPPPKLPVALVLALPRPKMLRRILRSVAEFGVRELHLINSYRVEKSYWQTPVLQDHCVRDHLLLGLEQAVDTVLPTVRLHPRFKPWVEDEFPLLIDGRQGILAHPGEHPPCPRSIAGEAVLAVGPEGGFTDFEVEQLRAGGCAIVSLGTRILRVENAVSALLARLD